MIDNVVQFGNILCMSLQFWRIAFSTHISRRASSALYRDSKEQYNADCLANPNPELH